MIGYKCAIIERIRVIITLEIPDDAITNINRNNVVVKEYAKHRTNIAKVIKIEDQNGKQYDEAISGFYDYKKLIYKVNEIVKVDDYDSNLEKVCLSGIHFFLTRRVAEIYEIYSLENGLYEAWYDNGQKWREYNYVNGKIEGLYQEWHTYGQIARKFTYMNDLLHGLDEEWYESGQKMREYNYVNGKVDGVAQLWYNDGKLHVRCTYINTKIEGLFQKWNSNGQIIVEYNYVDGKPNGLGREWYDNGQISKECMYVNGKEDGLYQLWNEDGKICLKYTYVNGKMVKEEYI